MSTQDTEPTESAFFTTIRNWGIVRGPEGLIGGVISGAGARVGMAPWPARIVVILAAFLLFPIVMLAYAAGWALLPDAQGSIVMQNFGRGVMNTGALIGIAILTIIGFFSFSDARPFGRAWFGPDIAEIDGGTPFRVIGILLAVMIPIAVIGGIVALIVVLSRKSGSTPKAPSGAPANAVYALTPAQARAAQATDGAATSAAPHAAPAAPSNPYWTPPAPKAPKPPKPYVPGPGRGFYLTALAWALIAAAGVAWAQREDLLSIYPVLAWGMLFFTGLGVILIAVSLSGRKLGFLGFLGWVGVIPALLLLGNHDELLIRYNGDHVFNPSDITIDEIVPQVDPTSLFSADYQTIYFASSCWVDEDFVPDVSSSTARIALPSPLEADAEYEVLAATTTVTMQRGTGLTLTSDGWAQATLYFSDRDLVCTFPGEEGDYAILTNPGEPVATLTVHDDAFANTIVIEEN